MTDELNSLQVLAIRVGPKFLQSHFLIISLKEIVKMNAMGINFKWFSRNFYVIFIVFILPEYMRGLLKKKIMLIVQIFMD